MRALVFVALMALVACGPAPSVELAQPLPPAAPKDPAKPTTPTTDPNDGTVSAPTPIPVPATPRLRAVCTDSLRGLSTISSAARPTAGVPNLKISFESAPNDKVTAAINPVPVTSGVLDRLDVLFEGARETGVGGQGPLRLLFANVDLPMRTGVARDLGPKIALTNDTLLATERLGIQARNFGVSDEGTYLLVPRGKSIDIVSHATFAKLATLALDPSKTVMPQIFERENLVTALVQEKGSFRLVVAKFAVAQGSVSVSTISALVPSAGSTFFAPSWFKPGVLVWVEAENKANFAPRSISFVSYDLKKGSLDRARVSAAVGGERVSPQVAIVRGSGAPLAAVAFETSRPRQDPINKTSELVDGRLVYVHLSLGTATELVSLPYPASAIKGTKTFGFSGPFAVRRVLAPTGALEALVSVDTHGTGEMLYKERAGALDGVGGLECKNPNVIEEAP